MSARILQKHLISSSNSFSFDFSSLNLHFKTIGRNFYLKRFLYDGFLLIKFSAEWKWMSVDHKAIANGIALTIRQSTSTRGRFEGRKEMDLGYYWWFDFFMNWMLQMQMPGEEDNTSGGEKLRFPQQSVNSRWMCLWVMLNLISFSLQLSWLCNKVFRIFVIFFCFHVKLI